MQRKGTASVSEIDTNYERILVLQGDSEADLEESLAEAPGIIDVVLYIQVLYSTSTVLQKKNWDLQDFLQSGCID